MTSLGPFIDKVKYNGCHGDEVIMPPPTPKARNPFFAPPVESGHLDYDRAGNLIV